MIFIHTKHQRMGGLASAKNVQKEMPEKTEQGILNITVSMIAKGSKTIQGLRRDTSGIKKQSPVKKSPQRQKLDGVSKTKKNVGRLAQSIMRLETENYTSQNIAQSVAHLGFVFTAIMMTMTGHWMSGGYVHAVTLLGTKRTAKAVMEAVK